MDEPREVDSRYVHVQGGRAGYWAAELQRYDAGWLHRFDSSNGGDLRRATWDDLNSPARLPVLLAAGLPVLQKANPGHAVTVERVLRSTGAGLLQPGDEHAADLLRREVAGRTGGEAAWGPGTG